MTYKIVGGPTVEYRAPHFVAASVAIIVFLQVIFIVHNSYEPTILSSINVSEQAPVANATVKAARTHFPRKIWQTSKTGPGGFDDGDREALRSWTKMNQKWRYESMTQYGAESYVRDRFGHGSEITEIFIDLQDPILRADFIRYLVLLADGGLYTDLDTRSLKPIDDWVPTQFRDDTSVVVGVEYDRLSGGRWVDWTLDLQFSTWAILAKPNHPVLERTVQSVIKGLKTLALKQGKTITGVKASREEVLDTTGPALFTRSVFDSIAESTGRNFTWLNVTRLKEPRLVEDILILPITAFGCGQQHSDSGKPDEETALVQHLFKGSWKGDHQMEADMHEDSKDNDEKEHQEQEEEEEQKEQDPEQQTDQSTPADQEEPSPETTIEESSQDQDSDQDGGKDAGETSGTDRGGRESAAMIPKPHKHADEMQGQGQDVDEGVDSSHLEAHIKHQLQKPPRKKPKSDRQQA